MFLRTVKGCTVEGIGRVRAGSVLAVPDDLSAARASLLLGYKQAVEINVADGQKPPERHLVTREEQMNKASAPAEKAAKK